MNDNTGLLERIHDTFRRIGLSFPYLASLVRKVQPQLDTRVRSLGIFASGRLLINPDFVRPLSPQDLLFVLTHELYHLTLRTHERMEGTDPLKFNHAHDYIINDLLREEMQLRHIPVGGLDWPGARQLSAEKILGDMQLNGLEPSQPWDAPLSEQPGDEGGVGEGESEGESGQSPAGDVLSAAQERQWFPDLEPLQQQAQMQEVQEQARQALNLQALMDTLGGKGRGTEAGGANDSVAALRGLYRPPWELALQRWMETVAPSDRSYARPSRRGADRRDVVLPGRKREGWALHIVLDTSGSMVEEVPKALGAIADFCEALGVEQVHLVQCDTEVGRDEVLAPAEVARWQITGYGGSNLTPAMLRLAENSEVEAAIVLTDGDIEYPETAMPYNLLWVLPAWKQPEQFTPRYGKVIAMTQV